MEKNLPSQTIQLLSLPIRVLSQLRAHLRASAALLRKMWYYGTNLQAIGFLFKTYNVIINGKNFYDQPIDTDIKLYEEIRKLTTGEG